jgi:hypothetical protein
MVDVFNRLFFDDLAAMTRQERIDLCACASTLERMTGLIDNVAAGFVPAWIALDKNKLHIPFFCALVA